MAQRLSVTERKSPIALEGTGCVDELMSAWSFLGWCRGPDPDARRWAARRRWFLRASWSRAHSLPRAPPPKASRRALPQGGASCPGGRDRPDWRRFFRPLLRRDRTGVQGGTAPVKLLCIGQTLEQHPVQKLSHPCLLPVAQPSPAGHARTTAHLGRQQLPRRAGAQHKDDACEHRPVRDAWPSATRTQRCRRQQRLNFFPQFIAHQRLGHNRPNLPENPVLLDALASQL